METGRGSFLTAGREEANLRGVPYDEGEHRAVSFLEKCAVFAMTFGPGCAVATYTTSFGWYQHEFHSREALVWMRMAVFTPFPLIKILQQRYDAYFDEVFTVRTAYLFRVVIMQLVVALLMLVWMFLPVSVAEFAPIIGFGVVLGASCAPFIGSSMQIAVALDPVLSVFTALGNMIGMSVPVIAVYASNFSPSSSHADLCKLLAIPMVICILTFVWLGSLHRADVFGPAFLAITQRRNPPMPEGVANPQDDFDDFDESPSGASSSEPAQAEPSESSGANAGVDEDAIPLWVWLWLALQCLGVSLEFFLLTLIGYFGDAQLTLHLATGTLLSSAAGRMLSLSLPYLPAFGKGPMHFTGVGLFCVRSGLWIVLMLRLARVWTSSFHALLVVWCFWMVVVNLHMSMTDLTVISNVSGSKKESVAQYGLIATYSGLFIGLMTASSLVLLFEDSINDDDGATANAALFAFVN